MDDMRQAIIPKSDQLNADDLIGRELTIKITGVEVKGGQEQPVSIRFEGDNGKPYKACKSMCRVMVSAWGPDSSKYAGRSMTLYRDAHVKWAGMEVGGIRISHMSDITEDMTMALTVTRANKKAFTVRPLAAQRAAPAVPPLVAPHDSPEVAELNASVISEAQHRRLEARIGEVGIDRAKVKRFCLKTWQVAHLNHVNQLQYEVLDSMLDDHLAKHPKAETAAPTGSIADMKDDIPWKQQADDKVM